jgi:nitrile hydratase
MTYISHADLGGKAGFGAVVPEVEGELFHAPWEPRVLALTLAMGATGQWNIDTSRAARETLPDYLQLTYYEIWCAALEKLLLERDLVSRDELATGHMQVPARAGLRVLQADQVSAVLARGAATQRPALTPQRFAVGERVRVRAERAAHHTRLPGYVLGKLGSIERVLGTHIFADTHAQGQGEAPDWLYTVAFEGAELWGKDDARSGERLKVSVDAWQSYLEAV